MAGTAADSAATAAATPSAGGRVGAPRPLLPLPPPAARTGGGAPPSVFSDHPHCFFLEETTTHPSTPTGGLWRSRLQPVPGSPFPSLCPHRPYGCGGGRGAGRAAAAAAMASAPAPDSSASRWTRDGPCRCDSQHETRRGGRGGGGRVHTSNKTSATAIAMVTDDCPKRDVRLRGAHIPEGDRRMSHEVRSMKWAGPRSSTGAGARRRTTSWDGPGRGVGLGLGGGRGTINAQKKTLSNPHANPKKGGEEVIKKHNKTQHNPIHWGPSIGSIDRWMEDVCHVYVTSRV